MAPKQLMFEWMEGVMIDYGVSPAEIEKYKLERSAERSFVSELNTLVKTFEAKVSPKNAVLRSMQRFLKSNV